MTKEMVISANRHETKVAILEDDQLVEILFQRSNEYSLAGSIHKGRVTRVLPGMQSAFVDLGLERDTFLYVSDFFEENEDFDPVTAEPAERSSRSDDRRRGGEDRGPRPDRTPPPAPVAEAPAVEAVPAPATVVPAADNAEPAAMAQASAAAPSTEEGDPRDRRNRRGRRRRNRGRGFPESKYASEGTAFSRGEEPEAEAVAEPAEVVEVEDKMPPILLPGESISKYQKPLSGTAANLQNEPKTDSEEPQAETSAEAPAIDEPEAAEAEPVVASAETAVEAVVAAVAEAPEEETVIPAVLAAELAPGAIAEFEGEPDIEPETEESAVETDEAAAESESEAEADTGDDVIADGATEGEAETEDLDDIGSELSEADAAQEAAEAAMQAEANQGGTPEVASATVREQSGRYMHRVTRRQRRKMRGGNFEREASGPGGAPKHAPPQGRPEPQPQQQQRPFREREKPQPASITELLKEGQEILVQIAKEPLGQKGARITSHIALPGRYVVYMPTVEHLGVSRKIGTDEERLRLKRILQTHRAGMPGGFIMRTAGEGKSEEEIAADMTFLVNLWMDIRQKSEKKPAPALIHHDLDIVQRILRDQLTENFKAIWVDNEDVYESVLRFVQRFQPALVSRVKMYTRPAPIFEAFSITNELEKALRPKVWLKSGGYIVINQTEALVAIDVNTGKFVGKSNRLEDTIVKTNTEAVKEIVRQIRLRDLGGIIVVDFIDMDERKNRQKVMQALEEAMRADRAPNKILQFNDFGLVAITRKRVKQSLERALCSPCPHCEGAGYIKSVQTVVNEILLEAQKIAKAVEGENVILRVHPDVAKVLKSNDNQFLEEIEEILKRPVMVKGDPALHHEKFDLA